MPPVSRGSESCTLCYPAWPQGHFSYRSEQQFVGREPASGTHADPASGCWCSCDRGRARCIQIAGRILFSSEFSDAKCLDFTPCCLPICPVAVAWCGVRKAADLVSNAGVSSLAWSLLQPCIRSGGVTPRDGRSWQTRTALAVGSLALRHLAMLSCWGLAHRILVEQSAVASLIIFSGPGGKLDPGSSGNPG